MEGYHRSVLLKEAVEALIPPPCGGGRDAWYLDCTLGDGGHALAIIKEGGKVVGIDVDPQALKRVQRRFREEGISKERYKLILGNFRDLGTDLKGYTLFAGAIFDLGVSSLQLNTPKRGFSFAKEGPLDMRMDPSLDVRALDLIKILSRKELYELFNKLGQEKYSWHLASALAGAGKIKTTKDLADLVQRVVGERREKIHPATRIFQALRIAVNDELGALREGLVQVKDLIERGGRIVVISYHSLEDRIVKNAFKNWQAEGIGKVLTKKPVLPTRQELEENPRSRSAKMRIFKIL